MFRIDVSSSYERFGLERNPFTDLSSEAIRDIEKFMFLRKLILVLQIFFQMLLEKIQE